MSSQYNFQYCPKLVILSEDRSKVLLCKRKGEADYDGTFSFIGGKMEVTDQSITDAIRREKNEEIGEDSQVQLYAEYSLNVLFRKKDGSSMIVPHHLGFYKGGEIKLNSEEYSEYVWIPLSELAVFEPKIQNIPEMVSRLIKLTSSLTEEDLVNI